jgi:hypothetical protein
MATLRFAGWQAPALPAACACDVEPDGLGELDGADELDETGDELWVDAAPPVCAAEELLELADEQPAAVSPAVKTHTVTAVDVRNRMDFLRGLKRA